MNVDEKQQRVYFLSERLKKFSLTESKDRLA